MKKTKVINVEALLNDLDSVELKALKKLFNSEFRESMHKIEKAEIEKIRSFIDGLDLTRGWNSDNRNVVSLIKWNLPRDQSQKLGQISETISRAFTELDELKRDVAQEIKRTGENNSKMFKTTIKRVNRYLANNDYSSGREW
jgi:uncharacterized protein Yka (UPF0111/DUF47 family)